MNKLEITTGKELLNTTLPETQFTVSQLLSEGLHILGGSPKIGKSWLVLWWCLQISNGEPIWNFETKQGTVLYLALEDPLTRLQDRLLDMTDDAPDNLKLAIKSDTLSSGLKEQIENFCTDNPDTKFIVIDTLQKIRISSDSANQYAQDYKDMDILKELAHRFNVSILLVHHLRKMEASDPIDMLSGSTGLSGEVDGIFLLKKSDRFENTATLSCTGRDIKSRKIELNFNEENHIWETRNEEELILLVDETVKAIAEFLDSTKSFSFSGSATQLSELIFETTGRNFSNITLSKKLMKHWNQLEKLGYKCELSRTKTGRMLNIAKTQ